MSHADCLSASPRSVRSTLAAEAHTRFELAEGMLSNEKIKPRWTEPQGQYLAFIYTYELLHDRAPSEAEMQAFFRVSPPSAHRMVVELEKKDLIKRTPRAARSIKLLVRADEIPRLKRVSKSR